MRKELGIGCLALAAVWALTARADEYVTLLESDAKGSHSFGTEGHWSDGLLPHDDADYLVALGDLVGLRTPPNSATSVTFGGRSLTVGVADGEAGAILHKAAKAASVTYPDLRLVKGTYSDGAEYGAYPTLATLLGTFTVLSPKEEPFSFIGANNRAFDIGATFVGASDTAIRIAGAPNELNGYQMIILRGASPDYYGSFIVEGSRGYLAVTGEDHPLGAESETLQEQAVILRDNGAIRLLGTEPATMDPNKGVWVDPSGGRLYVDADTVGTSAYTFTGDGVLVKDGLGTAILAGRVSCAGLQVSAGELQVAEGCQLAEGLPITFAVGDPTMARDNYPTVSGSDDVLAALNLTVTTDGAITAISPRDTVTIRSATFAGGGVASKVDLTTGENSVAILDETCTVTWPMQIRLNHHYPAYNGPNRYKVLMVPKSLKIVTEDDFVDVTEGAEYGLPLTAVQVAEDEETGFQAVYIRRLAQVIEMIATGTGTGNVTSAPSVWSDNLGAHANASYLVYADVARGIRTGDLNVTDYVFPGTSLTLVGTSKSNSASLNNKAVSCTIADFRLYAYSKVGNGRDGDESVQSLYGKYTICGSREKGAVYFTNEKRRTMAIYADLYGDDDALIILEPTNSNNGIRHYELYGDNTNYYGSFDLYQNGFGTPGLAKFQELSIEDETNLGGNPHAFNYRALRLAYYSQLVARKSLTIDDPNRGILIDVYGQFAVGEDIVMTVTSPIALNGTLRKGGLGLLELGSPISFGATGSDEQPTDGKNILLIAEGRVKPLKGSAFSGLNVQMALETGLVIAPLEGDDLMREKGLLNLYATPFTLEKPAVAEGEEEEPAEEPALAIRLEYPAGRKGNFQVPLLTVTAEAADQLRGHIALDAAMPNYRISVEEKTVEEGVQFYADYRDLGGTIIFLQ